MKVIDPLTGALRPVEKSIYLIDHEQAGHKIQRTAAGEYCNTCERAVYAASGDL